MSNAPLPNLAALGEPRPGAPRRSLLGLDEEDGGDVLLGLIQDWSIDGDGITDLCKKVSTWCLAAGRGSSMCADPNDVQWLTLCWRIGWPKPAVPQTRPMPPTVEEPMPPAVQFTWQQTFYAMCKALNTERGTFADAKGRPDGRNWYVRMVREQRKPQALQQQGLLERAVFEWSLNAGDDTIGGREVPPPVMRACARAWYAAHPLWVQHPVDVNMKRLYFKTLDRRILEHVENGEAAPLRGLVELGGDIDVHGQKNPPTPLLQTISRCLRAYGPDDVGAQRARAFEVLEMVLALGADVHLQNDWSRGETPLVYTARTALRRRAHFYQLDVSEYAQQVKSEIARNAARVINLLLDSPHFRPWPDEIRATLDALAQTTSTVLGRRTPSSFAAVEERLYALAPHLR